MNDITDKQSNDAPNNVVKSVLFLSIWLFIIFSSKKVVSSPGGEIDFLLKNVTTFIVTVIITGLMLHFLRRKLIHLLIPVILILAVTFAVI